MNILRYGDNEIEWSQVAELCEVTDNELKCIDTDNTTIVLRVFGTTAEAATARERLLAQIGGTTIIIVIDDL